MANLTPGLISAAMFVKTNHKTLPLKSHEKHIHQLSYNIPLLKTKLFTKKAETTYRLEKVAYQCSWE